MASKTFKYKKLKSNDGGTILRPVVPVEITKKNTTIRCEVLLDTGADICIFSGEIAGLLGIDDITKNGKEHEIIGVGGKATKGYLHKIGIKVEGFDTYNAVAFFSNQLNDMHEGILGQVCFFDNFKVTFDYQKNHIVVRDK